MSIADANDTIFWRVVIATGLTLLLCSVDRICMSVAILPMAAEFSWSPWVQGVVQAAFLVGYAMTQAIGGALADRVGGKVVTAYAIKLFSLASLVLPICLRVAPVEYTLAIVVAVRFLGAELCVSTFNHVPPRFERPQPPDPSESRLFEVCYLAQYSMMCLFWANHHCQKT